MSTIRVRHHALLLAGILLFGAPHALAQTGSITTVYGTYFGGNQSAFAEEATDVAIDGAGNAYLVGSTDAADFPSTPGRVDGGPKGGRDGFLAKFSPAGALLFALRFGGSDDDDALSVHIDATGNIHIGGETQSIDFPIVNPVQGESRGGGDGFLITFSSGGESIVFSDYFGGSGADSVRGIVAASPNTICICGDTTSPDLEDGLKSGIAKQIGTGTNAFAACINTALQERQFAMYLGDENGFSGARAIALDSNNAIVVVGETSSPSFPVSEDAFQSTLNVPAGTASGFVVRLTAGGVRDYGTYLGGSNGPSSVNDVALDGLDRIILGGDTSATNFPRVPNRPFPGPTPSGFVAQFNVDASALLFSDVFAMVDLNDPDDDEDDVPRETVVNAIATAVGQPLLAVGTTTSGVNESWFYRLRNSSAMNAVFNPGAGVSTGAGAAMDVDGAVLVAGQMVAARLGSRRVNPAQGSVVNGVDAFLFKDVNTFVTGEGEGEGEGEGGLDCELPDGTTNLAALQIDGASIGLPATFTASANGYFDYTDGEAAIAFNIVHDFNGTVRATLLSGPPNEEGTDIVLSFPTNVECGGATAALSIGLADGCGLLDGQFWLLLESQTGLRVGGVIDLGISTAVCAPEGEVGCDDFCPGDGLDFDGDGLDVACEACLGTSDMDVDFDDDGMPDNFEVANGFDPLDPADAAMDRDLDGLTNLREFIIGSDPNDPDSPGRNRFVSPDGVDAISGGLAGAPWKTIQYALLQIVSQGVKPVRLRVAPGVYPEDVTLVSGVTLEGQPCDLELPGFDLAKCAVVRGTITGVSGATLDGIVIQQATPGATLLTLNNVAMRVNDCVFLGDASKTATGIRVSGGESAAAIIDNCDMSGLATGVDVFDSIPIIRKTSFTGHSSAYINLRQTTLKQVGSNGLGRRADPNSGFNRFDAPKPGELQTGAVVNQRPEAIMMQGNEWGSNDPATIDALISGPADFEPFLAVGSAILAGSVFVTVWNADDQVAIPNASVSLLGSPFEPVTDNDNGVYPFASVPAGNYTVMASANGFTSASRFTNVASGGLVSITIPLGAAPPPPGGCNAEQAAKSGTLTGDLTVAGCLLLLLCATTFALRRREAR